MVEENKIGSYHRSKTMIKWQLYTLAYLQLERKKKGKLDFFKTIFYLTSGSQKDRSEEIGKDTPFMHPLPILVCCTNIGYHTLTGRKHWWNKEKQLNMIRGTTSQKDTVILNMFVPIILLKIDEIKFDRIKKEKKHIQIQEEKLQYTYTPHSPSWVHSWKRL